MRYTNNRGSLDRTIYERVHRYRGERKFRVYTRRQPMIPRCEKRKSDWKEKKMGRRIAAYRGVLLTERIGESSNVEY